MSCTRKQSSPNKIPLTIREKKRMPVHEACGNMGERFIGSLITLYPKVSILTFTLKDKGVFGATRGLSIPESSPSSVATLLETSYAET